MTFSWLIFRKRGRCKLQGANRREHLIGMAVDSHVAPDADDPAILADQYGGATNALERPPIHGFFTPGSVGLEHAVSLVRSQRHHQSMLVAKGLLGLWRVGRYSHHGGSIFGECTRQSRE